VGTNDLYFYSNAAKSVGLRNFWASSFGRDEGTGESGTATDVRQRTNDEQSG
jgi:hypothetical protein